MSDEKRMPKWFAGTAEEWHFFGSILSEVESIVMDKEEKESFWNKLEKRTTTLAVPAGIIVGGIVGSGLMAALMGGVLNTEMIAFGGTGGFLSGIAGAVRVLFATDKKKKELKASLAFAKEEREVKAELLGESPREALERGCSAALNKVLSIRERSTERGK